MKKKIVKGMGIMFSAILIMTHIPFMNVQAEEVVDTTIPIEDNKEIDNQDDETAQEETTETEERTETEKGETTDAEGLIEESSSVMTRDEEEIATEVEFVDNSAEVMLLSLEELNESEIIQLDAPQNVVWNADNTITWEAVEHVGERGYSIEFYYPDKERFFTDMRVDSGYVPYTALVEGALYYVRVKALTPDATLYSDSEWSDYVCNTTEELTYNLPSNLQWSTSKPGKLSFEQNNINRGHYVCHLYKDSVNTGYSMTYTSDDITQSYSVDFSKRMIESGEYMIKIYVLADGADDVSTAPYAESTIYNYSVPERLEAPQNFSCNFETKALSYDKVDGAEFYEGIIEWKLYDGTWSEKNFWFSDDFFPNLSEDEYRMALRAYSGNIEEKGHSELSDYIEFRVTEAGIEGGNGNEGGSGSS